MEDWQGLAEAVRQRRDELGISQEEVAFAGGPSTATMYLLETAGQSRYRGKTLASLERALGWPHGTVRAILRHEPPPAPRPAPVRDPVEEFVRANIPPNRQDAALAMLRALIEEDRPTTGDRKIG